MTTRSSRGPNGLFKLITAVAVGYVMVTGFAAAMTPIVGGKDPAFAVWLIGGAIMFVTVAGLMSRRLRVPERRKRLAVGLLLATAVCVATLFLAFVLMVNVWEGFGLGY